jgi:hypothetical protein
MMNSTNTVAYITGTTTDTDRHNYVTDTMSAAGSVPAGPTAGSSYGNVAEWHGMTKGWIWASGGANLTFDTETWSSGGTTVGTDGWGKGLSSKLGYAYVKNGGNTVTSIYKLNDITGAQLNTSLTSTANSGEENFEMGKNWGYFLALYNSEGVKANTIFKINYLTDAITAGGSTMEPQGHTGASSGATASCSAFNLPNVGYGGGT